MGSGENDVVKNKNENYRYGNVLKIAIFKAVAVFN
jgi:hypothetical protein